VLLLPAAAFADRRSDPQQCRRRRSAGWRSAVSGIGMWRRGIPAPPSAFRYLRPQMLAYSAR
jgi:hypothetical protein